MKRLQALVDRIHGRTAPPRTEGQWNGGYFYPKGGFRTTLTLSQTPPGTHSFHVTPDNIFLIESASGTILFTPDQSGINGDFVLTVNGHVINVSMGDDLNNEAIDGGRA